MDDDWEDEQEDDSSPPPEIDFCTLGMFIIGMYNCVFLPVIASLITIDFSFTHLCFCLLPTWYCEVLESRQRHLRPDEVRPRLRDLATLGIVKPRRLFVGV